MRKFSIIMIDDNPIDCLLMQEAIFSTSEVVEFRQITDSKSGSSFIEDSLDSIDLLILDLNLPGKSGIELLVQIRSIKSYKRLPVIIFSNSSLRSDVYNAYEKGANAYLQKPIDQEEFDRVASGIIQFWAKLGVLN